MSAQIRSISIFVMVYLVIVSGRRAPLKLDRTSAGPIGGVLMVLLGVLTRDEALRAIDFSPCRSSSA